MRTYLTILMLIYSSSLIAQVGLGASLATTATTLSVNTAETTTPLSAAVLSEKVASSDAQSDEMPPDSVVQSLKPTDEQFQLAVQAVRDHEFRKAINLFEGLAESGASDAQYNLALLLKLGRGAPQNFSEAYFWSVLSILGGEDRAMDLAGEMQHILPEKVKEEIITRIITRLRSQINDGNIEGPRKLGRVYSEFSISPDMAEAYIWFSICNAIGEDECEGGMALSSEDMEAEVFINTQIRAAEVYRETPFFSDLTGKEEGNFPSAIEDN